MRKGVIMYDIGEIKRYGKCMATVFDRNRNELGRFPASRTICPVSGGTIIDFDRDFITGKKYNGAYGICWNYHYKGFISSAIECFYY